MSDAPRRMPSSFKGVASGRSGERGGPWLYNQVADDRALVSALIGVGDHDGATERAARTMMAMLKGSRGAWTMILDRHRCRPLAKNPKTSRSGGL
jgi:hypothetical protein